LSVSEWSTPTTQYRRSPIPPKCRISFILTIQGTGLERCCLIFSKRAPSKTALPTYWRIYLPLMQAAYDSTRGMDSQNVAASRKSAGKMDRSSILYGCRRCSKETLERIIERQRSSCRCTRMLPLCKLT